MNTVWADQGLNGTGQIIVIDDSGLDTGDMATVRDFKGQQFYENELIIKHKL